MILHLQCAACTRACVSTYSVRYLLYFGFVLCFFVSHMIKARHLAAFFQNCWICMCYLFNSFFFLLNFLWSIIVLIIYHMNGEQSNNKVQLCFILFVVNFQSNRFLFFGIFHFEIFGYFACIAWVCVVGVKEIDNHDSIKE